MDIKVYKVALTILGVSLFPLPYGFYQFGNAILACAFLYLCAIHFDAKRKFISAIFLVACGIYLQTGSTEFGRAFWVLLDLVMIAICWWCMSETKEIEKQKIMTNEVDEVDKEDHQ